MKTLHEFITEALALKLTRADSKENADAFMHEYHETTSPHPWNHNQRIHDNHAILDIHKFNGAAHLSDIRAIKPGGGHKALEHLKKLSDKHGVKLTGTAKAYAKDKNYPMNSKQLASWYKKRGFNVKSGSEDDGYDVTYHPRKD